MSVFDIVPRHRLTLIQTLQLALEGIQEREQLTPDDPILLELKKSIIRTITELDIQQPKDTTSHAAERPAHTCPRPTGRTRKNTTTPNGSVPYTGCNFVLSAYAVTCAPRAVSKCGSRGKSRSYPNV